MVVTLLCLSAGRQRISLSGNIILKSVNVYRVAEVENCVILEHNPALEHYRHCAWLKWLAALCLAYIKTPMFS